MKSYIAEFRNNKFPMPPNKTFIKFGITKKSDAMERFTHPNDDYSDWDIKIQFSMNHKSVQQAEAWEQKWLTEVFPNPGPNKVWVERVLGCPSNTYYSNCSGITELRLVTIKQSKWIIYEAYKQRDKATVDFLSKMYYGIV